MMRRQFSIRTLLIAVVVVSVGLAAYLKLRPRPPLAMQSHIRVHFSKGPLGQKRIHYQVHLLQPDGKLLRDTYLDGSPLDGNLEVVGCQARFGHDSTFAYPPTYQNTPLPTPRMLAVFHRIRQVTEQPIQNHDIVWQESSLADPEQHFRVSSQGLDELLIPLPDDQATRDAYRVVDDHGHPLP